MTDNFYMVQAAWCFCQRFSVLCLSKATCSLLSPTCRCVSDVWLCVLKDFSLLFQMLQGLCKEIPFLVDPQNKVQGARDSPPPSYAPSHLYGSDKGKPHALPKCICSPLDHFTPGMEFMPRVFFVVICFFSA